MGAEAAAVGGGARPKVSMATGAVSGLGGCARKRCAWKRQCGESEICGGGDGGEWRRCARDGREG